MDQPENIPGLPPPTYDDVVQAEAYPSSVLAWQQQPPPPALGVPLQQPPSTMVTQPLPLAAVPPGPTVFTTQSVHMLCPKCKNMIMTITHKETGVKAKEAACCVSGFLLICGLCCLGLCLLYSTDLMDTVHTCPICKIKLGTHFPK